MLRYRSATRLNPNVDMVAKCENLFCQARDYPYRRSNVNPLYRDLVLASIRRMRAESQAAAHYDNNVLKGQAREIFVSNLLRPYLAPSVGVCGGVAIDSYGGHSKQLDLIVFDRRVIAPSMLRETDGVIPVESVLATVEVKSTLTRHELVAAVDNARSVKVLRHRPEELEPGPPVKNSPLCYVFAFTSDLSTSELARLQQVVAQSNETGVQIRVPVSGLCVPEKGFVHCIDANVDPPVLAEHPADANLSEVLLFVVHVVDGAGALASHRATDRSAQLFVQWMMVLVGMHHLCPRGRVA